MILDQMPQVKLEIAMLNLWRLSTKPILTDKIELAHAEPISLSG